MAASFTDSFNVAQAAAMCLAEARRSSQVRLPLGPSNCVDAGGPTGAPPAWHTLPDEPNEDFGRSKRANSILDTSLPHAWDPPPEESRQPLGASSGLAGSSPAGYLPPEGSVETLGQSRSMGDRMPAWHTEEPDQALSSAPAAEGRRRLRSRATREPLGHHAALPDSKTSGAGASAGMRVALGGTLSRDEQRVLAALMMLRSVH